MLVPASRVNKVHLSCPCRNPRASSCVLQSEPCVCAHIARTSRHRCYQFCVLLQFELVPCSYTAGTMTSMMGKVGAFVGLSEAGPSTTSDAVTSAVATVTGEEEGCACPFTLTKKQRFQGFGICFGVGMLLSFLSLFFMLRPISFALLLSFGNITSYMSTGFLVGPRRQCKSACDPKRALASIIFFVASAS